MLNHHFSQKLKLIRMSKFNNLINIFGLFGKSFPLHLSFLKNKSQLQNILTFDFLHYINHFLLFLKKKKNYYKTKFFTFLYKKFKTSFDFISNLLLLITIKKIKKNPSKNTPFNNLSSRVRA
jgi:hypothetical protein